MEANNMKAMREALKLCVDEMCARCRELAAARGNLLPCLSGCEPVRKAKAALAEPVKNCEVGTVAEQAERFDAFCQSNMQFYKDMFGHDDEGRLDGWDCREDCPVGRMIDNGTAVPDRCQLAWAQMPYIEQEGGAK